MNKPTNAEYLEELARENQLKREREAQSKEHQARKKLEDREKGFNVYMQGANQHRPAAQNAPGS